MIGKNILSNMKLFCFYFVSSVLFVKQQYLMYANSVCFFVLQTKNSGTIVQGLRINFVYLSHNIVTKGLRVCKVTLVDQWNLKATINQKLKNIPNNELRSKTTVANIKFFYVLGLFQKVFSKNAATFYACEVGVLFCALCLS